VWDESSFGLSVSGHSKEVRTCYVFVTEARTLSTRHKRIRRRKTRQW